MRRVFGVVGMVVAAVGFAVTATPAWAHSEFDPGDAPGGSTTAFMLHLENEKSDSGTTMVQLVFPEGTPVVLAELPAVTGWETSIEGGAVGAPVTGVTWSRPTAPVDEDPALPITLGPLPAAGGRLQFKVLQTYADGDVDRWIEDWPEGAPEPDAPGPVINVAAGETPTTTATETPTTVASTPTTAGAATTTTTTDTAAADTTTDDDSNGGVIAVIIVVAAVAAALGYLFLRRRRGPPGVA